MKRNQEKFVKEWGELLENHKMRFVKMHTVGMAIVFFLLFLLLAYFTDVFEFSFLTLLVCALVSILFALAYGLTMFYICKNYLSKIKKTDTSSD